MTGVRRAVAAAAAAALLTGAMSACGAGGTTPGSGESAARESAARESAAEGLSQAADLATCSADARPTTAPYGDGFPADWPFPPQSVVFHAEDRGADGTIVTAVSSTDFQSILDYMNQEVVHAGFAVEKGETEDRDAEAEWEGNGFRGRWAIRESAQCEGETIIQVLSTAD